MFSITGRNKKQILGLTITPNLGLEAVLYNEKKCEIEKYCQKPLEYNIASREIQDMNAFRSALSDIYNEFALDKENVNLYLVLPNVHFGFRSIEEAGITTDAIEDMILSDAGESYIFKQEEPQSAWLDMNAKTGSTTKYIAHSSIQRKMVNEIQDAVMDVGGTIIGVESAASAIPRGVAVTGVSEYEIQNNQSWDILLINPNNYSIFQMSGNRILDYVEVPFATMSFEGDEVYAALSTAVGEYLPNYPAKKLVIISQTDKVSAGVLKNSITFDEKIVSFESNRFGISPCVPVSDNIIKQTAAAISLGALGAVLPKYENFPTLNVLGDMSYDGVVSYGTFDFRGKEYELTSALVAKWSILISSVLLVLLLIIGGALGGLFIYFKARATGVEGKITEINAEIEALNKKLKASIVSIITQINNNNKQAINYYVSLSSDIPSHVWLTYYINKNGKDVGIEGFSIEIKDIYEYYKSLKVLAPNSDIKLNKLEVFKQNTGTQNTADQLVLNDTKQQAFSFEISNTTYQKSFDKNGNKIVPGAQNQDGTPGVPQDAASAPAPTQDATFAPANSTPPNVPDVGGSQPGGNTSYAAKIPNVPDVEINLKEIK